MSRKLKNNLAVMYMELGQYAEAEPLLTRALAVRGMEFGREHPNVAVNLHNLAIVNMEQARYAERVVSQACVGDSHEGVRIK
jgi:hypothetical protein